MTLAAQPPHSRLSLALCALERYALYALVFSLPLQALTTIPGAGWTLTKAMGGLAVLVHVIRRVSERRPPFARAHIESGIALFAAACLASLPHSIDSDASWNATQTFFQYALLFYAIAEIARSESVQVRIPALFVSAAALSGLAAMDSFFWGHVPAAADSIIANSSIRRLSVGLPDPNHQALLFLFATSFLLFERRLWRGRFRAGLSAGAFLAIAVGLALTMSRAGWAVCIALALLRVVASRRRFRVLGVGVAAAAGITAMVWAIHPALIESVQRRATEFRQGGDASIASRVWHYAGMMNRAQEGGAFGFGLDTAHKAVIHLEDPLGETPAVTVHNVPLLLWIETGWTGLAAYGWLWSCIAASLCAAWLRARSNPDERARLAAYAVLLGAYGAISLVMPFVYYSGFAVLLGCAIGAANSALSRPASTCET